ncbi:MAG TPA: hypothetical protein VF898_01510 [Chloroflexota bacterium]
MHATRGELLCRLGRTAEARDACRRALGLVHDDAERRLLEQRPVQGRDGPGSTTMDDIRHVYRADTQFRKTHRGMDVTAVPLPGRAHP